MNDTDAVIGQALRAAIRAPSVHNTQSWRFVVTSPAVEPHLDRDRVLPVADPFASGLFRSVSRDLIRRGGRPVVIARTQPSAALSHSAL